ncbi:MAG: hypothetical protein OCD01_17690 [Fibrobacterales bacterium]
MNNNWLFSNRYNKWKDRVFWLIPHLLLLSLFLISGPYSINTDLYSILPDSLPAKQLSEVERKITHSFNGEITILIGHPDFSTAKNLSDTFYNHSITIPFIDTIHYKINANAFGAVQSFFNTYKHQFLAPDVIQALKQNNISKLREDAFFTLSSPVSIGALDYLDEDPYLLAHQNFQYFIETNITMNTAMNLQDSVLTRNYNGMSWILMRMHLQNNSSIDTKNSPIPQLQNLAHRLQKTNDSLTVVFSGIPFHSYESTIKSHKEITILSTLSTIFLIILVLYVFRSIAPLISSILAISFGAGAGLVATMFYFKDIHIFTIVFGTSLIGISVDYSFHFLCEWASNKRDLWENTLRKKIFPALLIGLITTTISYVGFTLSSFPLLQQMALFSIVGLTSSFLSVFLLFPSLNLPKKRTQESILQISTAIYAFYTLPYKIPPIIKTLVVFILVCLIAFGLHHFSIKNDIRSFYKMSNELKHNEILAKNVLAHNSSGVYILTEGTSLNDNIIREERIIEQLEALQSSSILQSYISISQFIPSQSKQDTNVSLINRVLAPTIEEQFSLLSYTEKEVVQWNTDYLNKPHSYIAINDFEKLPIGTLVSQLNIGMHSNKYYTMIMLFGINDIAPLKSICQPDNGIYLIDKVTDINNTMQRLSIMTLYILFCSYILIYFGLSVRHGVIQSFKTIMIPIAASFITLYILEMLNIQISLFVIVGLILIPGMGTDYLIILTEAKSDIKLPLLSITMSMLTTLLAFGMLGFSSFANSFGLTVSIGIFWTYVLCSLFARPISKTRSKI